jgi:hypothetical protein
VWWENPIPSPIIDMQKADQVRFIGFLILQGFKNLEGIFEEKFNRLSAKIRLIRLTCLPAGLW